MFYERVTPVIGNILRDKCIGVINIDASIRVIQFLASCGVVKFKVKEDIPLTPFKGGINKLKKILSKHNESENYEIGIFDDSNSVDLVVGILTESNENHFDKVNSLIGGFFLNGEYSINFNTIPQGLAPYKESFYFNWLDLSNQLAHYAVALLLEGTYWEQTELINYLRNKKQIYLGDIIWPWYHGTHPRFLSRGVKEEELPRLNKSVLIAGCGSIGSVIADCLKTLVSKITLIDHKDVSPYNPVRQEYDTSQIGLKKVFALSENLLGKELTPTLSWKEREEENKILRAKNELKIIPIVAELDSENPEEFITILEKQKPDLVILSTGSVHEYELAEILWEKRIPHVSLRCYPRARWFEIIIVMPPFTPCFGCIRGHLYMGPLPTLTAEQEARYDPDYKEGQLEAEPAIKPDSARCAEVGARIVYQMLSEKRENWFVSLSKHSKTVLIGGNRVEVHGNDFCYGIKEPGQVVAFGLENLNGSKGECLFCRRILGVEVALGNQTGL